MRGFITCGDCERPLTANFSKSKTGKKHPYYMCFNKSCDSYRKSIRRADIEGEFETLLRQMRPAPKLIQYVKVIFKREWDLRLEQMQDLKKALRRDILALDKQIEALVDRITNADSMAAVSAYERRITKLERDKLVKAEKLEARTTPQRPYEEMFELALNFLSNPWKLWDSAPIEHKRTVLKLAFDERLAYSRNDGLRTPKTTLPFKVLGDFDGHDLEVAEGESALVGDFGQFYQRHCPKYFLRPTIKPTA